MAPSSPSNAASLVLLRLRSPLVPLSFLSVSLWVGRYRRELWFGKMRTTSLFVSCVPATERYLHSHGAARGSVIFKKHFFSSSIFCTSTYPWALQCVSKYQAEMFGWVAE